MDTLFLKAELDYTLNANQMLAAALDIAKAVSQTDTAKGKKVKVCFNYLQGGKRIIPCIVTLDTAVEVFDRTMSLVFSGEMSLPPQMALLIGPTTFETIRLPQAT